jgi:large subunit ribosomal protein L16
MLEPKKTKFRKQQKDTGGGKKLRGHQLSFGSYGLKALEDSIINARHIESVRQVLSRSTKKGGKLWIRVFPDRPITTKGTEVPMGGGKGDVTGYEAPIRKGKILFEVDGIEHDQAKEAFRIASHKLGFKTRFITR